MAFIMCPCGNRVSNTSDGKETSYDFIPNNALKAHWNDMSFFSFPHEKGSVEFWKCDSCDNLIFFEKGPMVSRYMKRIDATELSQEQLSGEFVEGICFNNLFFNSVDSYFTWKSDFDNYPEYKFWDDDQDDLPKLTMKIMQEEVFSHKNGRFLNWWHARLYDKLLVFYSTYDPDCVTPVKAWKEFAHVWSSDE